MHLGTQQYLPGEELYITRGATARITYRVQWENNQGDGYHLYAGLDHSIFTVPGNKNDLLTIVYNTCTSRLDY